MLDTLSETDKLKVTKVLDSIMHMRQMMLWSAVGRIFVSNPCVALVRCSWDSCNIKSTLAYFYILSGRRHFLPWWTSHQLYTSPGVCPFRGY